MFQQVILNWVAFMLNSNEPFKVAHLKKLANNAWIAHLWKKAIHSLKARKALVFDIARIILIKKKKVEIWAISTGFCWISKLLKSAKEQKSC